MRFILMTLTVLASLSAGAYPEVGDTVQWKGEVKSLNGSSMPLTIKKEITGYDSGNKLWQIKTLTKVGSKETTETKHIADVFTQDRYKEIMRTCVEKGGRLEKITTNTGTYETCRSTLTTTDGVQIVQWWGDLPFGIVTKNTKDQGKKPFSDEDLGLITFE